jgi:prophage antirepressor-like protein
MKILPFQKWIAGEVIPSIRKHGIYALEPLKKYSFIYFCKPKP